MAPRAPTGRDRLLADLRRPGVEGRLPLRVGSPTVKAGITRDGAWQLRVAETDEAALGAFREDQRRNGRPFYPEHVDAFRNPTGAVLVTATDLTTFCERIEAFDWPSDW